MNHTKIIKQAIAGWIASGRRLTTEEAAYDLALVSGSMSQRDLADRWGWSKSDVNRKHKEIIDIAHQIASDLCPTTGHSWDTPGTEIADSEPETNEAGTRLGHSWDKPQNQKEKEQKEKKNQKKKNKKEKNQLPLKENPLKGSKEKSPSSTDPKPAKRLVRPDLEEATVYFLAYCQKNKIFEIDAEAEAAAWFDHKQGNGWKTGKNPIKNWQATCRTWIRMARERKSKLARNNWRNRSSNIPEPNTRTYNEPEFGYLLR